MSVITKTGYIDFYNPEYLTFHATQYDDGTRSITLTPKNGSEMLIFEPNKWDASVIYCKSDNNVCMDNAIINNDYSITFTLSEQMLAIRGRSVAQFCLTRKSDGKTIRSTAFYVIVNESTGIEQLESTSEFNTLNILIKKINNAYTQTESIIAKTEEIEELYNQAVSANTQADAALEIAEEAVKVAAQVSSDAKESANKALSYQSNALKYSQNAAASATEAKNAAEQVASTDIGKVVSGETAVGNSLKLGNETATQWQSKLDSIQTTSRATLSTAGWYRVAEYTSADQNIRMGAQTNSVEIMLRRVYDATPSETVRLLFDADINRKWFSLVSHTGVALFTKVRFTYDSKAAYIEVYYDYNAPNRAIASIGQHDKDFYNSAWKAIDFVPTSETVDGVTITATYDIPANASPVNNIDLTTALAGYLKNTGGDIDGNISLRSNGTDNRVVELLNSLRRVSLSVNPSGVMYLWDGTNSKEIIKSNPDGINTFNGTATGNLALDAIIKSATAPSNTTLIWIDTANKKTKAYIDGAWTIIA